MRTYTIDGCNEMFLTLQEAKKHIWLAYTPKECIKELTNNDGEMRKGNMYECLTFLYPSEIK